MRRRRADAASATRLVWGSMIAILVLFTGAFAYAFYGKHGASKILDGAQTAMTLAATTEAAQITERDTDGDGIADWEEILWGTNPNAADSNGDGVADSREDFMREPLAAVDDNTLYPGIFSSSTDNATQLVARELLGSYMLQVRNANVNLSEENQNLIVQNSLDMLVQKYVADEVRASDLVIVPSTPQTIEPYIGSLSFEVAELVSGSVNDYQLMQRLTSGDKRVSVELQDSAERTLSYVERLKQISVPSDVAEAHAELLSALSGYAVAVKNIASIQADPARAALGIQTIMSYQQRLQNASSALEKYIRNYGEVKSKSSS